MVTPPIPMALTYVFKPKVLTLSHKFETEKKGYIN